MNQNDILQPLSELNGKPAAKAVLSGSHDFPNVYGTVLFYPVRSGVLVAASVRHLPQTESNFFGFHIHEGGMCVDTPSSGAFSSAGGHYNPGERKHPQHAGDLPPLLSAGGSAWMSFVTNRFQIKDILHRTVIIHDMPDDFTSQPAGNSGMRIACGVILPVR